jgi:hypothetical protein
MSSVRSAHWGFVNAASNPLSIPIDKPWHE